MGAKYWKELKNAVFNLDEYSKILIQKNKHNSPAVVFDIDETLVVAGPSIHGSPTFSVIPGMNEIYDRFKKAGWTIFLITGRQEIIRDETEKLLDKHGFTDYEALYMRPTVRRDSHAEDHECVCFIKERHRMIAEKRFAVKIVLNVGDQDTDFAGGYYEVGWHMPKRYDATCKHLGNKKTIS